MESGLNVKQPSKECQMMHATAKTAQRVRLGFPLAGIAVRQVASRFPHPVSQPQVSRRPACEGSFTSQKR